MEISFYDCQRTGMMRGILITTITVRYDVYNDGHEIAVSELAKSWQGFAKIISDISGLVVYRKETAGKQWQVEVTTRAELRQGSILSEFYVYARDLGLFQGAVTSVAMAIGACLQWFFVSRKTQRENREIGESFSEEVRELRDAISVLDRKVSDVQHITGEELDRLAEQLGRKNCCRSGGRKAVSPIGTECRGISACVNGETVFDLDEGDRHIFDSQPEFEDEKEYLIRIERLDKRSGGCLVRFPSYRNGNGICIRGQIKDPRFVLPNNDYLDSFANRLQGGGRYLRVSAVMETGEDGEAVRLHILRVLSSDETPQEHD